MGDFEVDTDGRCFLCMEKASSEISTVKLKSQSSPPSKSGVHSLHYLSRYVKLDMSKVFSEGTDVPPDLLAKVAKARLKVELCEDCHSVNESFSKLYRQLERIELKMTSHMQHMHRKLTKATDAMINSRIGFDDNAEKFKIAEALRNEAKQKCFRKLNTAPGPKVRIQKWSMKQVNVHRRKNTVSGESFDHETSHAVPEIRKVKEEYSSSHLLEEDVTGNDYFDESADIASEDMGQSPFLDSALALMTTSSNISMNEEPEPPVLNDFTENESMTEPKFEIQDGSYKCKGCTKRFSSKSNWHSHYKSVHLKIKYKCNLCEMEFALKGTFTRHHQSVHMGVRFKCLICNKTFTQKGQLTGHQKRSNCKRGKLPKKERSDVT